MGVPEFYRSAQVGQQETPAQDAQKGGHLTRPPRRGKTRHSAGKAAASEEARRTLRYVEPLNDARTKLTGFFSILLGHSVWPQ